MGNNGAASDGSRARTEALLEALLRSQRRDRLCAEVARITAAPAPLVEDVFQEVCERVLRGKCRGQTIGEVYSWLQLATVRLVQERLELAHWRREVLVDTRNCDEEIDPPLGPSCEDEVIQREKERELSALVSTALADLDERHRSVAALHSHGFSGPAIATRLDTSERRVKHLIAETFAHSRDALVDAAGGGCQEGERLISRYSFGLANPSGRFAAQAHMASCDQCATLYRRLELAHEKIAALLPIPAVVEADPGLLEGVAHKGAHTLAQAKQQLAEAIGAGQAASCRGLRPRGRVHTAGQRQAGRGCHRDRRLPGARRRHGDLLRREQPQPRRKPGRRRRLATRRVKAAAAGEDPGGPADP